MRNALSLLSIIAVLLFAGIAVAEDTDFYFEDEEGPVFYITLPDTWSGEWQETEELTALHAVPKDESLYISILAAANATPENIGNVADQIVSELVTDYNFEKWEERAINGIPLYVSESAAKIKDDGEETEIMVAYFTPKKGQTYILYAIGAKEDQNAHEKEINAIFGSLRTKE
ncbi:hypothetical protein U14_02605 [Candidatus Moduliflexus flocculans]|uniref:PsbP C-terminal domain-containing protein n=1 Tax=Candidatus Moduliflexus flocculans TaxID=1499966 RepID=A0A081BLU6_9BACT|nr:hypothetical protein U14_02605 [Candidatus Moduliflexus flocculans]